MTILLRCLRPLSRVTQPPVSSAGYRILQRDTGQLLTASALRLRPLGPTCVRACVRLRPWCNHLCVRGHTLETLEPPGQVRINKHLSLSSPSQPGDPLRPCSWLSIHRQCICIVSISGRHKRAADPWRGRHFKLRTVHGISSLRQCGESLRIFPVDEGSPQSLAARTEMRCCCTKVRRVCC